MNAPPQLASGVLVQALASESFSAPIMLQILGALLLVADAQGCGCFGSACGRAA